VGKYVWLTSEPTKPKVYFHWWIAKISYRKQVIANASGTKEWKDGFP